MICDRSLTEAVSRGLGLGDFHRQIVRMNRLASADGYRILQGIFELANIARPVVAQEIPHGVG